jgi:hypothetical protein
MIVCNDYNKTVLCNITKIHYLCINKNNSLIGKNISLYIVYDKKDEIISRRDIILYYSKYSLRDKDYNIFIEEIKKYENKN